MNLNLRNRADRNFSVMKRLGAGLLLWALLSAVFPLSFFSAEKAFAPDGMAYCPLSKKLQFIKPTARKKQPKPFDYLCAGTKTKDFLFHEIILKNPLRAFSLDADGIEKLAFDVLTRAKTTPDTAPDLPPAPFEKIAKRLTSIVALKNRSEHESFCESSNFAFSPVSAARPPTAEASLFAPADAARQSAGLARRSAPRAPPSFSS